MNRLSYIGNTRRMFFTFLLLYSYTSFLSQKLTVQVSANKVQVGSPFQIVFTVNAQPSTYTPPNFQSFDIFSGPNTSQSMQYVNGAMSQSFSISFLIAAKKEGKLQIGPMIMIVSGQTITSNPVNIEAVKGAVAPGQQNQQQQTQTAQSPNEQSSAVSSGDDVFVKTTVSKSKCYIGEQIMVTQKIYSRFDLRGFQNVKFPAFNGFWSQQPEGVPNVQLQIENLDGVNYYVGEFNRTYVFPQRTGELTIDPTEVECVVRKHYSCHHQESP